MVHSFRTGAVLVLSLLLCITPTSISALEESVRLQAYEERGYEWPLPETIPNTDGWKRLQYRRLAQVERIETGSDRYNAWMAIMPPAIAVQNFTQDGWGLARAPQGLVDELKKSLHDGLAKAETGTERYIDVIGGTEETRPLFIKQDALNQKVLKELKPLHEAWAGIPLVGATAYGLRAYRGGSTLNMHVDKVQTHIISCILHVDHSEDSEPWPLVIEDFQGNTNEVVLESGDMLFYESSKCIHGRPKPLKGSWYSSLFVHYYPEGWNKEQQELECHYAIPRHWHTAEPADDRLEKITMVGTSMRENDCPHSWCGLANTVKWSGPAKEGVVISTSHPDGAPLQEVVQDEGGDTKDAAKEDEL